VWVIRKPQPVQPPMWYYNANDDKWLTSKEYERIGRNAQKLADAGYEPTEVKELSAWTYITDGNDRLWYIDPEDGHLYPDKPPFKAGITGPTLDYANFVDKNGKMDFGRALEPGSTNKGFVAFWTDDVSVREVQQLTNAIVTNPNDNRIPKDAQGNLLFYHARDGQNNVDYNPLPPDAIAGMFWSPSDRIFMKPSSGRRHGRGMSVQTSQRIEVLERAELRRKAAIKDWKDKQIASDQCCR